VAPVTAPTTSAAELEPLSRRLLQGAGVLSLLLILVVLNSLLNGEGESPFDPNPVAAAAERTQEMQGLRFSMKVVTSSESQPTQSAHGSGSFNLEDNLAQATFDVPSDQGTIAMEMVMSEDSVYMRSPQFPDKFPEGKEWLKVTPLLVQSGDDPMPAEGPESSLRMLAASGGVRSLGHRQVRGVQTRGYAAKIEMSTVISRLRSEGEDEMAENCERAASQILGPMRAEVFVDKRELLRRMRMVITAAPNGLPVTSDVLMDFFDFGAHPEIQLPEDSQVFDTTPLLEAQLEAAGEPS
jgi:hypothetical protein